jgi:N-acyl-L-homoserine lactone synthetase
MVMLHRGNCPTQCRISLRPMFEARKALFVDLLGWRVPVVADRYEIDRFDSPRCAYLVDSNPGEPHLGSLRLLPTTRPHILDTLFPALCDGPVPTGPSTWEITRLCLPARLGAARRLAVRNRLISAMVDHALEERVETLTGVVEMRFLSQILDMGWRCRPLGPPARMDGALLGAFRIDLDAATPAALASRGIYTANTLAAPCAMAA